MTNNEFTSDFSSVVENKCCYCDEECEEGSILCTRCLRCGPPLFFDEPDPGEPSSYQSPTGSPQFVREPFDVISITIRQRKRKRDDIFIQAVPAHFVPVILAMEEKDRTCPICMEVINKDIYLTSCYHLFHINCFRRSMEESEKCPNCRKKIKYS